MQGARGGGRGAYAVRMGGRWYGRLVEVAKPGMEGGGVKDDVDAGCRQVLNRALAEACRRNARWRGGCRVGGGGGFCLDKDSSEDKIVFNRTVSLKDAWAKEVKKG